MKKKKSIYILLPIVILVWGAIIVKVFFNFGNPDSINTEAKSGFIPKQEAKNASDSFNLFLDYPDPFLGKVKSAKSTTNAQSFQDIKSGIIKNPQQWPDIKYYGLVKNTKTKALKANISIDNKMFILKKRESVEGLRLEKISSDSIIFSFKYENKTFFKNQ